MVDKLFKHIGYKVWAANPWINGCAVNCVELLTPENEKRVVNLDGQEKEDLSFNDTKGRFFYIKIDPKFQYAEERQITSCQKEFRATVNFKLVYFEIDQKEERSKLLIENILVTNLRQMSFGDYSGVEQSPKIQLVQSNTDAIAIFKQELGTNYEFGAESIFVAIDGKLTFISRNDNCDEECGVATWDNILKSVDFCDPNVLACLTAEQINCLKEYFETMYKEISYTGAIDGSNNIFVATEEIVQIFKNGQLIYEIDDYVLSTDKKTATLIITPDPAFGDKLKIYGNI